MFTFNEQTYSLIHQLYNTPEEGDRLIKELFVKGLLVNFIRTRLQKQPLFMSSDLKWVSNEELDLSKINDFSLLALQKIILSFFRQLPLKCKSSLNAFGLLKIWIKIMQEDEQINGDLRNTFSNDYVFNPNPESMNRHIAEVEREISENPLSNLIFTVG
jgi:hypothetical protein